MLPHLGVDDARYRTANSVVKDRRFYSCVANTLLLRTPLKAFTDPNSSSNAQSSWLR